MPSFTSSRPSPPTRSTRSSPSATFSSAISSKPQPENPLSGLGEAVVQHIAGAQPGGEQRAGEAPIVGPPGLRVEDRAGRREDAGKRAHWYGAETAERRFLLLQLRQVGFAGDRQSRQGLPAGADIGSIPARMRP